MIKFKEEQETELKQEFKLIRPFLRMILLEMCDWVESKGHQFVITDLLSEPSEDHKLKRVSSSHTEKRAADIRCRDWPQELIKEFEFYFENKFKKQAAVSKKTGLPNLILFHDNGGGKHLHVQIKNGV